MAKIRMATVWLAGCSGCHMSFLDLDEFLFDVAEKVDVVYSPVGSDIKEYPENVDVCLVEGAIANEENLELALKVRERTKTVISFGDCAVTANVPAMRNMLGGTEPVLKRCYLELGDTTPQLPNEPGIVPELLDKVRPLHETIKVDLFIPGCPPPADRIKAAIAPLLEGQTPTMEGREMIKFG
ncbi:MULTISPECIES: oxidoreductase [Roseofilum]|uniref:Oxidoreductase n=1 Tax=Roseofilum reptotaenium AO1-A TaxID=1925591 RepID=A0A1L9QMC6_9CYAN|nr:MULTISPECIES: oxidoreductase [Roseofilum]OJJ22240.1 oxidoreductase [Roseofilum reptotaenium AO1-A]MBP0008395.1 oxidoreductase [Roseofilum sp. Belize Diploria]MBP0015774.1 oxidoreductase [Roseofilum sp. SID3]MBP0025652.1 oxidoreductase [Roseofilum sp. SID2]MBP0029190.1 oxidoreductase [Roseofilum sp. Guam]